MWNRKVISFLPVLVLLYGSSFGQCTVNADATYTEITCGECVTLSHFGSTSGNISFSEDFNNGQPTGWSFTQQASFNNPCSPNGVDGTTHLWMGDQSASPRSLETLPLNFGPSVAPAGGTICFDMLYAIQGNASPCEGPDEPDEGVYLQYSIDGGNTWITIHYFDPNGGNDPQLVNWNNWCFPIPAGALVNNVQFRWFQDADSGAEYDHWGIDNVEIIVNDPNVTYTWQHDGYTTSLPGDDPTPVCPLVTTTYTVDMTTSTGNCQNSVQVVVTNPDVQVDAGADQTVCPGDCINLAGTAAVVNDPGGPKTFENNQTETFDASIFGGASVNVNVQDLNMSTVNPGSITQVCLTSLDFTGLNLPPSGVEALSVTLVCPDGTQVELVPIGGAPAGSFINASSYQNTCFVPSGGSALSGANPTPITGTYNTSQPLSGMNGCTANGVWSISVETNAFSGSGTFDGWSITFDDEPDEYTPDVVWSPTTDMAAGQETTLTPQVCPTSAITYTLTASDDAGCVTVSDDVTITIDPNCCDPQTPPIQGPSPVCENESGSVYSVTNTPGSTFTWTVPTGASIVSGQGTNSITVNWGTTSGQVSVVETIQCGDGPAVTFDVTVQPCAGCTMTALDLTMTDCYTTSQSTLEYDLEATLTFSNPPSTGQLIVSDCFFNTQTFTPPFISPMTVTFTGLPQDGLACDFGAVFSDDQNCNITTTFTAPPTITYYESECVTGTGEVTGSIEFNNPPSTGTIVVEINDGTNTQSTNIQPPFSSPEAWSVTGLDPAAASYTITYYFSDFPTCEQTQTIICGCSADAGTTTATITGSGLNDVILCDGDQFQLVTNGDYTYPEDNGPLVDGNGNQFPYAPAINFLVYSCPPTPGVFPNDDPCFLAPIPIADGIADINDANSIISLFPPGTFTNNEVYYVPITTYSFDPVAPTFIVLQDCWNMGPTTMVTYLEPTASVVTPDCQTNTVSVNLSGGYAEVYGGDFTASNLQPATADFVNSTCQNGGDIVVENLQNGDNYSFDVTDENGCPLTISGGPFVALPIADAGTDAQTCQLFYQLQAVASYGTGTWTGGPAGTTFTPDANTPDATVTVTTAGSYTFTWTEDNGNGCTASDEVVIDFSEMSIPAVITDASCGSSDGQIVVAPQGGVSPYSYSWTSGGNGPVEGNLGVGNVTVTVTDATGCSLDSTFTINQPVSFNTVVNSADETCFNACDGSIDIQPDGAGPYTYTWTPNVANSNSSSTLCQDDYQILVSDQDGCTKVVNVTISGPAEVVVSVSSDVNEVCIGGTANLTAQITGGVAPLNYAWTANPADPTLNSTASNPAVNPTQTTTYSLMVTDTNGCQSAPKTVTIDVLPPLTLSVIRPLFSPDTSICPYDFATIDLQAGGGDGNYDIFLLPDNTTPVTLPIDTQPLVTTTFDFMVSDGCGTPPAFASSTVTIIPLPTIVVNAEPDSGCQPLTVDFSDLTQPTPASWTWSFGDPNSDSNTASVQNPSHEYEDAGSYTISLSVTTVEGCVTDTVLTDFVQVFPLPSASFDLTPEVVNLLNADIEFTDHSIGDLASWNWTFGDGASSTQQNPTHLYSDTGTYIIHELVTTIHGCTDEAVGQVIIEPDFMFYAPNAFTPNENGKNDGFRGYGEGIDWDTYKMSIFDRWGELIYYTEDINDPWDGTYKGAPVQMAVYVWRIKLNDVKGNDHSYIGHVTLLR
ncbi:MAG: T9SS type B sorting domain-containing protein [Flavobacteriales bacterium]|nr:T9SS type B sorting domain-containing protein [Flavobacteriales bacterium]